MSKIGQIGQEELISIRAGIGIALNFGSPELARQALEVAKQLDLVIYQMKNTQMNQNMTGKLLRVNYLQH